VNGNGKSFQSCWAPTPIWGALGRVQRTIGVLVSGLKSSLDKINIVSWIFFLIMNVTNLGAYIWQSEFTPVGEERQLKDVNTSDQAYPPRGARLPNSQPEK
jgi:hypothetical protein